MPVSIISTATAVPQYVRSTPEILELIGAHLRDCDDRFRRKVLKMIEFAQVDRRYSIMPPEDVFKDFTFAERNQFYHKAAIELGTEVLGKALATAEWKPDEIDFIITTSCTGIMIPSVDAYLINALGLRQDVVRLPVTEMGCAAGISALIYAQNFLAANPGKKAAIVAIESPIATFQTQDFSMTNMVSAAIFGDGAAAVLLENEVRPGKPAIVDTAMYHFPDNIHMMGFDLVNTGLQLVLDVDVPETIAAHFHDILLPFLARNKCTIEQVNHLVFHPGGKKIISMVESLFEQHDQNLDTTKQVLREFGNMSSATVLFVLHEFMTKQQQHPGDTGLMLSFGPGFSAQTVLLNWQ